jgi:hypothetical protein
MDIHRNSSISRLHLKAKEEKAEKEEKVADCY